MTWLRLVLVVALAVGLTLLAAANWVPVVVRLGGQLELVTPLPVLVGAVLLAIAGPMAIAGRIRRALLKQRLRRLEAELADRDQRLAQAERQLAEADHRTRRAEERPIGYEGRVAAAGGPGAPAPGPAVTPESAEDPAPADAPTQDARPPGSTLAR